MAIKFTRYGKNGKETRIVDTEPMLSAFYNSSDLGPNARVGQDMGWRLAPEDVVRVKKIKQDEALMTRIAANFQIPRENLTDTDVLFYISEEDRRANKQADEDEDHTDQYQKDIAEAEKADKDFDPKRVGETASEEAERVSVDNRAPIEKASGSVHGDDPSVSIDKKVIKDEEQKRKEVVAAQETSQQHEEGSMNDGTAAHEEGEELDNILADSKDTAAENARADADNRTAGPVGTQNPEQEGREQAEENTGVDLPDSLPSATSATGPVDQNADQLEDQAEQLREEDEDAQDAEREDASDADDGGSEEEKADEATSVDNEEDEDKEVTEAYSRSRAELNKLAESRGVEDPESYPNKDSLAEAIKNVDNEQ